jgi:radical SAM PhpK family P-methyltransferase
MNSTGNSGNVEVDCLLIGHNEMNFQEYEQTIRKMGTDSGAYRDLALNFLCYNNKPYPVSEVFNLFCINHGWEDTGSAVCLKPLQMSKITANAVAYLGTYLHRRGFVFDYINSFQDQQEELAEKLIRGNIRTIAITTTLYVALFPIIEIVEFIRKYNREARIIVGGPFIATQARVLEPDQLSHLFASTIGADFYVNSPKGEASLVKLIHALKNNLPVHGIPNIYYRSGGGFVASHSWQEDTRLAENMVNWDLFADRVDEFVNIRTAVSCPFSCAFCGYPEHAGKYQAVGVKEIEQELNLLKKIKTLKGINIVDDTFNVPAERFKEILRMMIRNKYSFKWNSYYRCQFADRETVELMKESGCMGVFLGIESGSNKVLGNMNKKATREEYLKGVDLLKEYGIVTYGSFIVGFPGETADTVRETRSFIRDSGLNFYRAQLWYCDPITPIWKQRGKYRIKGSQFEWSHCTTNSKMAGDFIDDMFLTIEESTWVPYHHFDFDNLMCLIHRGMSPDQVRNFLKSFNNGVREKLTTPSRNEVSYNVLRQLKNCLLEVSRLDGDTLAGDGEKNMDILEAEFFL